MNEIEVQLNEWVIGVHSPLIIKQAAALIACKQEDSCKFMQNQSHTVQILY